MHEGMVIGLIGVKPYLVGSLIQALPAGVSLLYARSLEEAQIWKQTGSLINGMVWEMNEEIQDIQDIQENIDLLSDQLPVSEYLTLYVLSLPVSAEPAHHPSSINATQSDRLSTPAIHGRQGIYPVYSRKGAEVFWIEPGLEMAVWWEHLLMTLRKSRQEWVLQEEVVVKPELHAVWNKGKLNMLPGREWEVFCLLLKHRGRFVSTEEIRLAVWDEYASSDTVRQYIYRLRKKLSSSNGQGSFIQHRKGMGYWLGDLDESVYEQGYPHDEGSDWMDRKQEVERWK
ncbi:winged helix-turn-helix domain-containing protein [Marinicrinis sediminis]|uniref:Transcriptional regulator n=1 Tax=Marinicrinis sediminis TaxID=1652465 RepID=A0ABW5RF80_9BACL